MKAMFVGLLFVMAATTSAFAQHRPPIDGRGGPYQGGPIQGGPMQGPQNNFPNAIICDRNDGISSTFYIDFVNNRAFQPNEVKVCYSRVGHNTNQSIMLCFDTRGNYSSGSRDPEGGADLGSCANRPLYSFRILR